MNTNLLPESSIAAHAAYQQSVTELIETELEREQLAGKDESAPARLFADAACDAAWNALAATVDAYTARRLQRLITS